MKTEYRRLVNCFVKYLGGNEYKYYKIVKKEDMLEGVKDERTGEMKMRRVNKDRTGPIQVEEVTSEEFNRIRRGENNGKNQEG